MKHHRQTNEILDRPPAAKKPAAKLRRRERLDVAFLRRVGDFASRGDDRDAMLVRRVEADILELIIRAKRRELGAKNG